MTRVNFAFEHFEQVFRNNYNLLGHPATEYDSKKGKENYGYGSCTLTQ